MMRELTIPARLDFMAISSYGSGMRTSGVVQIFKDLDRSIEGEHVIIVEDIVDSGLTLLPDGKPRVPPAASLRTCVLLDKPGQRQVPLNPTTSALTFPTSSWSATAWTTPKLPPPAVHRRAKPDVYERPFRASK